MRRRLYTSTLAAALVAVWLAVPLLSIAHAVAEAHTYCSEHGTFEEAGAVHDGDAVGALVAAVSSPSDGRAGHGSGDHEHCVFDDAFVRELIPADTSIAFIDVEPPALDIAILHRAGLVPSIPLLLLAPKSSPPV